MNDMEFTENLSAVTAQQGKKKSLLKGIQSIINLFKIASSVCDVTVTNSCVKIQFDRTLMVSSDEGSLVFVAPNGILANMGNLVLLNLEGDPDKNRELMRTVVNGSDEVRESVMSDSLERIMVDNRAVYSEEFVQFLFTKQAERQSLALCDHAGTTEEGTVK